MYGTEICLYRLVGGAVLRYNAVDFTEGRLVHVGCLSILQVYCGGLY